MPEPWNRLRYAAGRRAPVRTHVAAHASGRFHRPAEAEGEPVHRHRGRKAARRGHGSRAAVRPAGTGQDHAGDHHRHRAGRRFRGHRRAGSAEEAGPHRRAHATSASARCSSSTRFTGCCPTWRKSCIRRSRISAWTFSSAPGRARARTRCRCPRFTAIGATTRQGLVSAPLRGRFGLVLRLNHYDQPS